MTTFVALSPAVALAASLPGQEAKARIVTQASQDGKSLVVGIEPSPGTKANADGPWSLKVDGDIPFSEGKTFVLGKEKFLKETFQFRLGVGEGAPGKQSRLKLTYFVCAADNSWCKRVSDETAFCWECAVKK